MDSLETLYERLLRFWNELRAQDLLVPGGWRGNEQGILDTEMAKPSAAHPRDVLYYNFMTSDSETSPFFVVRTKIEGQLVQAEVYPDRIEPLGHESIVEVFLNTYHF